MKIFFIGSAFTLKNESVDLLCIVIWIIDISRYRNFVEYVNNIIIKYNNTFQMWNSIKLWKLRVKCVSYYYNQVCFVLEGRKIRTRLNVFLQNYKRNTQRIFVIEITIWTIKDIFVKEHGPYLKITFTENTYKKYTMRDRNAAHCV